MLQIRLGLPFFFRTFSVIAGSFKERSKDVMCIIRIFKKLARTRVKLAVQKTR